MKKIVFDVMGNDNGVAPAVHAVNSFVKNHDDFYFILVGDKDIINQYLVKSNNIEILDVAIEVDKSEGLRAARKSDTSMAVAINLVKDKKADIVISSGDSGVYLAMATLNLKRIKGIKRPAFMPVFPTIVKNKKFLMLDVGANLDVTGEMLAQWAKIGNIFSKKVLKVNKPKIGIINVGHEENKGKEFHLKAYKILSKDKEINFKGFVEPHELLNAVVDVAIIDGYAGNMILKTMEGTMTSLLAIIKSSIKSKLKYKLGALISKGAFKKVKDDLDYRNVGLAWVIGLNHLVVKCHGSADEQSYLGAFNQIKISLENGLGKAFKEINYE